MTVIYPGSFDPPTVGHVELAKRAAACFERVIVLVIGNPNKRSRLSIERRASLMRKCLSGIGNLSVETGEGLLLDSVRRLQGDAILRGLRGDADYSDERPIAELFLTQYGVETVLMQCDPALTFISSSVTRELMSLNGSVAGLLPPEIIDEVIAAYQ